MKKDKSLYFEELENPSFKEALRIEDKRLSLEKKYAIEKTFENMKKPHGQKKK